MNARIMREKLIFTPAGDERHGQGEFHLDGCLRDDTGGIAMRNRELQAAWHFHNGTKHPDGYLLDYRHTYDPTNRPLLFKIYPDLEPLGLPLDLAESELPALEAIATYVEPGTEEQIPDLRAMARILHFSAGITKRIRYPYPWGEMLFRAASCTGALYHIELYLVCKDIPGLKAGVYHYEPDQSVLEQLRQGDFRAFVIEASGDEPSVAQAPAILIYTSVPWRNACKYQARAYRHAFWDSGTILSHSLAMSAVHALPCKVVLGFVDDVVVQLLDLDANRELPLALVPLGTSLEGAPEVIDEVSPLSLEVMPTAEGEIDFPAIHEMHIASSLFGSDEVRAWREAAGSVEEVEPSADLNPLKPISKNELPRDSLEKVILRRGSSRRFAREPISFGQLSTIIDRSTGDLQADFLRAGEGSLNQIYLIVNSVEGLESGAYAYHRETRGMELIQAGHFRQEAGQLALDQALGADASVDVYFMTSLREVLKRFGNRGYRAGQLEAAIMAGRMYLASYALGLGATGLTFFDDGVTDFFSPHAKDKSVMFLMALGVPGRRR
jgi:SagB-type dehydrogenase family enzyme